MLLIKLLLAHILGDFYFQPQKWVESKNKNKLKSKALYLHIAIHIICLCFIIVVWDPSLWAVIPVIAACHFIIDACKLILQNSNNKRILFFLDQLAHIGVLIAYYISVTPQNNINLNLTPQLLILITAVLFLTYPCSIIIKTIVSRWPIDELFTEKESLKNAGKYIGYLERVLVFIFIISGHWEAVGFLITAKSVFRFGDLKEGKQRKLTEYILIGTLISFGIAIVISILYLQALKLQITV